MEYSSATHVKSYGGANRVSYISPLFLTPWFHLNQAEPSDPVHVYLNIELLLAEPSDPVHVYLNIELLLAEPSDPVHVYLNIELLLAELRGRPLGLPHFQQLATNNIF